MGGREVAVALAPPRLAKARVFRDAAAELMGDMPLYIQSFPFLLMSHQSTFAKSKHLALASVIVLGKDHDGFANPVPKPCGQH